ncbi:MAG: hypothetical protein IKW97_06465 [Muribaculaceae bacterium]|nr:hypothetical protein [Muribaculaceae bacterium]MBR5674028.1 hypothetical protein [Muribaculaceae bacterium]
MRRSLLVLLGLTCLLLSGCSDNSYKLAKEYQTRDTFGFLVFVSESGKQYDDLWVNISGLDKTFLASTAQIVDGQVKGMRYGAQQGTRQVMIRQKNERLLYQDIITIRAGEDTIIKFKD